MSKKKTLSSTLVGIGTLGFVMLAAVPGYSGNDTITMPPYVQAPADSVPVMVKVELEAKNPADFKQYLQSANVIPVTRLASGIKYSWSTQDLNEPAKFTLIQEWTSQKQHQDYIQWRVDTGALKELTDQLASDPTVTYLTLFDSDRMPAQAPAN